MKKLIGDEKFYKMVCAVALPLVLQNFITNFVSFLDNIMVGRLGTEEMSGVAIVGSMIFIFNLSVFGGFSGAGIFTAQYYGKGDHKSIAYTMRYKLYLGFILVAVSLAVFTVFDEELISLFLNESGDDVGDITLTLSYAKEYIRIMLVGLLPFALTQMYSTTLRETGNTVMPMKASVAAVVTNLVFNYILIFGHFGAPEMGVRGAAWATVLSRFVELFIVVLAVHTNKEKYPFIKDFYKAFSIPLSLVGDITRKAMPLLFNEIMWSLGQTMLIQSYSTRGLSVVASVNITSTVTNVFAIAFLSLGVAISIVVGPLLGSGKTDEAKDTANKMIFLSVVICALLGVIFAFTAPLFPKIYNTEDSVRALAVSLMRISAMFMPADAFNNACYFTLRSGGKTFVTTLFDSVFVWVVNIPLAFCLTRFTQMNIIMIYFIVLASQLIKLSIGFLMVRSGVWAKNIVEKETV